jgi:hypothetical protein
MQRELALLGGSGVSRNNAKGFGSTASDGQQVAFVQRNAVVSSRLALTPGKTYAISLDVIQRNHLPQPANHQRLRLLFNGAPLGDWLPEQIWRTRTYLVTVPFDGTATLEVRGLEWASDQTAFVDNVRVAQVG